MKFQDWWVDNWGMFFDDDFTPLCISRVKNMCDAAFAAGMKQKEIELEFMVDDLK